jgi:DNA end-binding protein Ku
VVIRSREHIAAVKPNGEALVLELMHFADELVEQGGFDFPALNEKVADNEKKIAKMLIDTMSAEQFDPENFHDKYKEDVLAMIEARANGEDIEAPKVSKPAATNVVNLMDVLQRSLEASKSRRSRGASSDEDEADEKPAKRGGSKAKKTASAARPKRKKTAA